ncbi:MAG: methyltransferase domain-containing protein [Moraxellaceae bacterium]|nr:methyltransferase domain-containing protein [Moraxellaceae bacterium]
MTLFTCPICQSPLITNNKTWQCDGSNNPKNSNHSFDVARQGYINLLPVQQKKSKTPGDSQASILAREHFLQSNFYQPLQNLICQLINKNLSKTVVDKMTKCYKENERRCINNTSSEFDTVAQSQFVHANWLDVGCGEGYYSHAIANIEKIDNLIAIDISKSAVQQLAKNTDKKYLWKNSENKSNNTIYPLVASASQLPLADNSVQGISSIFSPIFAEELARVLTPQGILVLAKPDKNHLASMRQGLFDTVKAHNSDKFIKQLEKVGFHLIEQKTVKNQFTLNGEQLADLLTMTPYSYRAKREKREQLLTQAKKIGLVTEACFVVYVFRLTF